MAFWQQNATFWKNHGIHGLDENHGFRDFLDYLLSLNIWDMEHDLLTISNISHVLLVN